MKKIKKKKWAINIKKHGLIPVFDIDKVDKKITINLKVNWSKWSNWEERI